MGERAIKRAKVFESGVDLLSTFKNKDDVLKMTLSFEKEKKMMHMENRLIKQYEL